MFNSGILVLFDIIRALVFLGLKFTSHVFEISIHLVRGAGWVHIIYILFYFRFVFQNEKQKQNYLWFLRTDKRVPIHINSPLQNISDARYKRN